MTTDENIVAAGEAAFENGKILQNDPYHRGTPESLLWRSGWMGAASQS